MPITTPQTPEYTTLLSTLITANHILHHHALVDAFGHISIRHPHDASIYVMPGYLAPALVRSPADLIEYRVADSTPIEASAPKGYSERFIHGELFRRHPEVQCVIHSHSESVIPFMIARAPLRPVYHMAGFLGSGAPVWDITATELYMGSSGHRKDMLVNNAASGAALAEAFAGEGGALRGTVVLMRHHGFTCVGENVRDAVYRAIYTQKNARLVIDAMGLKMGNGGEGDGLDFLTEEEARGCREMNENTADKAWRLWIREVDGLEKGLYRNEMVEGQSK